MRSTRRPHSPAFLIPSLALLLAACTPSDGGGGGGDDAAWADGGVTFNTVLAEQYRASTEFNNVDADFVPGPTNQSNPYDLIKVYLAHSALVAGVPLEGTGQLVAVVDDGILATHREFAEAGKLTIFGDTTELSHGTHVASLIAGLRDDAAVFGNMHGVAPGADLHFTSWNPTNASPALFAITNVTAGTLDAAALGAVAQNNSWGFDVSANEWNSNTAGSTAARLNAMLGYGTSNWQNYLNALNVFQETGVVVWSMSNNESLPNGSIMGTLPAFEPSLAEAWITAINGYFEVNGSGDVTYAERLSAPCGFAATFCLAGDGTTFAADATGNSSYSAGTGTSYVAPQIAGAIALLAQAFPDLTPEEWTKRLLASADSSWFASQGVTADGTVNFGGGITRIYSDEWGLGIVDLAAALSPIGAVSVVAGTTIANANRTSINNSHLVSAGAFGDALTLAFDGREMAVFDYFNGNFMMDAGQLVHAQPASTFGAVLANVGAAIGRPQGTALGTTTLAGGLTDAVAGGPNEASRASVLAMATNTNVITHGDGPISVYGFAGDHWIGADRSMAGIGLDASIEAMGGLLTFGFNQSFEQGALLGMAGNNAFDFGNGSSLSAVQLGYNRALGDNFSVFANLEVGVASALGFTGSGLITEVGPVTFGGFNLGASVRGLFRDDDQLTFSVTGPTRVTYGEATVAMPVGRTAEGDILVQALNIDLAPDGRQRDFMVNYTIGVGQAGRLSIAAQYSVDAGNIVGAQGFGIALGYALEF